MECETALLLQLDIKELHLGTAPFKRILAALPASLPLALRLALPRAEPNSKPGKGERGLTKKDEDADENSEKRSRRNLEQDSEQAAGAVPIASNGDILLLPQAVQRDGDGPWALVDGFLLDTELS